MSWVLLFAPLIGALAAGAIVLLVAGFVWPESDQPRTQQQSLSMRWARITRRPPGAAGRRRDLLLAIGLAAGLVGFVITRFAALIVLIPLAMLVLPKLLGQSPPTDLPLLSALDRWVQLVTTNLSVGRSVTDAVRTTSISVPPIIREEVTELVQRLDARLPEQTAWQQFADELDSPEADAVIASLMLASRHPTGAGDNLRAISASIQDRIRALRAIETERQKPRNTARLVTILSLVLIVGTLVLGGGGGYLAPLNTPLGWIVVTFIAAGYIGSLLIMYRIALPRRRERILTSAAR